MCLVAFNVKDCLITSSEHWILRERPERVQKGVLDFFTEKQTKNNRNESH